ncbi:uncharacterized protein LOC112670404 [Canis lupus dingo]|uniref:uncharacterized protein LOC112670404 n=1 Tax=Canis lupus dingo TaxID=286419 RepID=UPI0020C2FA54|nr:uncharacterized protein LOC112670404 [Canis lupus dingo]
MVGSGAETEKIQDDLDNLLFKRVPGLSGGRRRPAPQVASGAGPARQSGGGGVAWAPRRGPGPSPDASARPPPSSAPGLPERPVRRRRRGAPSVRRDGARSERAAAVAPRTDGRSGRPPCRPAPAELRAPEDVSAEEGLYELLALVPGQLGPRVDSQEDLTFLWDMFGEKILHSLVKNLHSVSWCSTDRVYNVKNNPVLLFCPDTVLRKVLRTTRATPQRYVAFEENVSIEKLLLYKGNTKAKNKGVQWKE